MKGPTVDYCRHDNVDLDVDEDQYQIGCNQCGRWWRCYGDLRVVWSNFLRYECMGGGDPTTVNSVGRSPEGWATSRDKVGAQ